MNPEDEIIERLQKGETALLEFEIERLHLQSTIAKKKSYISTIGGLGVVTLSVIMGIIDLVQDPSQMDAAKVVILALFLGGLKAIASSIDRSIEASLTKDYVKRVSRRYQTLLPEDFRSPLED